MEFRWVGKKIDFALLSEYIERFFRDRGFAVGKQEARDGFRVSVGSSGVSVAGAASMAAVKVTGKPEDFTVEFEISGRSRASRMFDSLAALIGGGGLTLRRLKSEDRFRELEKDFWAYMSESLALF